MRIQKLWKLIIKLTIVQLGIALIFCAIFLGINRVADYYGSVQQSLLLTGNGQAIVNSEITDYLMDKGTHANYHTAVYEFPEDCKLLQTKAGYQLRSIKNKHTRQKINPVYPLIMGDGAYLYLYHSDFTLIKQNFRQKSAEPGTFLNNGVVSNQDKQSVGKGKVLFLKLSNDLYMNCVELKLELSDSKVTIPTYSVLRFQDSTIPCCSISKGDLEISKIEIDDPMAILCVDDQKLTYSVFLEKLKSRGQAGDSSTVDTFTTTDDLYQFFMATRYDYTGEKMFYRYKDGYFMECQKERSTLDSAPLYYTKGKKLLLPCDYVLVQPKLFRMNKMPALSQLTYKTGFVYAKTGKKINTLSDFILFDGKDTYLFFNKTTVSWNEGNVKLSPCSSITVGDDGSIGIYRYNEQSYEAYQMNGYQDVTAVMEDGTKVNLSEDVLYRPDGQEQILFSQPELLNEFK